MTGIWMSISAKEFILKRSYKIAFSIKELVQLTSDFSVAKASACTPQFYHGDSNKLLFVYRVRCKSKGSDPNGHKVRVLFDPSKVDRESSIDNLDVKVSCTCPAFLYWGAQWNLGQGESLEGKPRPLYQAPTDPRRFQFVICKHIKVVSDRLNPYLTRLLDKYRDDMVEKTLDRYDEEPETEETEPEVTPSPAPKTPPKKTPAPKTEPAEEPEEKPVSEPKKKVEPKPKAEPKPEPKKPSNVKQVEDDDEITEINPPPKKQDPKEEKVERTEPVSTKPKEENEGE